MPSASINARSKSDTAQFFHDRNLTSKQALFAVAQRCLYQPNVPYQTQHAVWLERCSLIAAPHGAIKRQMTLDHAGTEHHRRDRGRNASFVSGVTYWYAKALSQDRNHPKIQLVVARGICAGGMQNY